MIRIILLLLILVSSVSFAQKPGITHVITHNREMVVCNASKGSEPYAKWGVFPNQNYQVRKIMMNVTLGSPDSLLTAHWDYLDHIFIRRQGGSKGKPLNFEIGRMLTPYGSIYNKGWSWKWQVDVTDFSPYLRDSVEIEYIHSGYEAKTVGWALTIDFEVIAGSPVVIPLGITPLWNGGFKYGDPANKIEKSLLPVSFVTTNGTALSRIRIQHTGHGMDKPRGCSEFCSRWRDLKVDGTLVDHRNMWKDCGANPLYPQGGTWVYDRAYWCPGDLQVPDIIDVMITAGKHEVSLEMEPYTATENIQANEDISAYLFNYSPPTQKLDVAIDKIMVPTDEQQYTRLNPASFNPRFLLRNQGSENLCSVTITYGTEGFPKKIFRWRGDLKFNQVAQIVIPGEIQFKPGVNKYTVSLSKPNELKDGWMGDNELTTSFVAPEVYPANFILQFLTNNKPKDNRIFLIDNKQDTIFQKAPANLEANTLYSDTIRLKAGNYELCLTDTAGDGLEFWAEPQNGDGHLRMFDLKGNLIHAFESDCGNGEKLSFTASSDFVPDTTKAVYAFALFPRLVTDKTEFSLVTNKPGNMVVQITVDGVVWEKHEYKTIKTGSFSYNLSNLPKGRIVLEAFMDGVSRFKGRLNKKR